MRSRTGALESTGRRAAPSRVLQDLAGEDEASRPRLRPRPAECEELMTRVAGRPGQAFRNLDQAIAEARHAFERARALVPGDFESRPIPRRAGEIVPRLGRRPDSHLRSHGSHVLGADHSRGWWTSSPRGSEALHRVDEFAPNEEFFGNVGRPPPGIAPSCRSRPAIRTRTPS